MVAKMTLALVTAFELTTFTLIILADMGDVTLSPAAVVAITVLLGGLATALRYVFKLLMDAKDGQYKEAMAIRDKRVLDLSHEVDSLRGVARDSLAANELAINKIHELSGQPAMVVVPAVVPERHSVATAEQEAAAELATLRARAAVVARELGLPPRTGSTEEVKSATTREAEKTSAGIEEEGKATKTQLQGAAGKVIEEAKKDLKDAAISEAKGEVKSG